MKRIVQLQASPQFRILLFLAFTVHSQTAPVLSKERDHPGWQLLWSDEFDSFDARKWIVRDAPGYHFPKVIHGNLVVEPSSNPTVCEDRLGPVVSNYAQRFGRWEVRAKLPSANDLDASIRLLPDGPWPELGDIGIVSFCGNRPTITYSDFHWGIAQPFSHDFRSIPQRTSIGGSLVHFPADFHTYAVEWTSDQLRYYVDDVFHTVFYSDEVGDFLPNLAEPMRLTFAVESSDVTSGHNAQSRQLLVDWARIYKPLDSGNRAIRNGNFEEAGGSLRDWHVFGNQIIGKPNIAVTRDESRAHQWVLRLAGQEDSSENYSGISQGIAVKPGQSVQSSLELKVPARSHLETSPNRVTMKIEFYRNPGDYFGGPAMLGFKEIEVADRSSQKDTWQKHALVLAAPAGTVEARLSIVFNQRESDGSFVYIDDVKLSAAAE